MCISGYCTCQRPLILISGYCIGDAECRSDQILYDNRCYQLVKLDQPCFIDQQCPGESICGYDARCECPIGMQVNNQCVPRREPGKSCLYTEQCMDSSKCTSGYCVCPFLTDYVNGYCVRRAIDNSPCGKYQVLASGECLDLAPPGYRCVSNLQCLAGSTCPFGTCVCSDGFVNISNYCVSTRKGPFQCSVNEIMLNDKCYKKLGLGDYCIDDRQCVGNSECFGNRCRCPLGSVASPNGECTKAPVYVTCGLNEVKVLDKCFPLVNNIGERCTYNKQCTTAQSGCFNGICSCRPGSMAQMASNGRWFCLATEPEKCLPSQVRVDGQCMALVSIGQYCRVSMQCLGGSTCVNQICTCPSGTMANGDRCSTNQLCNYNQVLISGNCFNKVIIGDFCYHSEQCMGNAMCQMNRCTCPSNTVNIGGRCTINSNCLPYQVLFDGQCLDTVTIAMECQQSIQCIESASCVGTGRRTCQCNSGTYFTGSSCRPSNIQCPHSTVFTETGKCEPIVQMGQFCKHTSQCAGYAVCSGGLCKCPNHFQLIRNKSKPKEFGESLASCSDKEWDIADPAYASELINVKKKPVIIKNKVTVFAGPRGKTVERIIIKTGSHSKERVDMSDAIGRLTSAVARLFLSDKKGRSVEVNINLNALSLIESSSATNRPKSK